MLISPHRLFRKTVVVFIVFFILTFGSLWYLINSRLKYLVPLIKNKVTEPVHFDGKKNDTAPRSNQIEPVIIKRMVAGPVHFDGKKNDTAPRSNQIEPVVIKRKVAEPVHFDVKKNDTASRSNQTEPVVIKRKVEEPVHLDGMKNDTAPRSNQIEPVLIIYWSTYFGRRLDLDESWGKEQCPVTCRVTSKLSEAKNASAFIVHARDPKPLPPRNDVPWILATQENPAYTPVLQDPSYMSRFQLLKSYRLDSDFPYPTFTRPNFDPPIPFKNKTGNIMAAFSNCEPVRTKYLKQLMDLVEVDSYGGCHRNKGGLVPIYGSHDFREQKEKLARRYKFLLVFFNQDCDYFVDLQLSHALNAGAVPVVMATTKLDEFMPGNLRNAFINVRDFKSPRDLAEYLTFLANNETEYNKYLEWKFTGFGDINGTVIGKSFYPEYPIYCQICTAISEGKVHKEGLKPDYCRPRSFNDWLKEPQSGASAINITSNNSRKRISRK